ncbi:MULTISPECIES: hypothetical protein [Streptomyces]|uniref:Uncharacterized protein n=1 Tax=Streptomyces tsukubensis (strain DSM 42081 / NBRC 108919 / NRRL 18488 / 9993) TaxID=1114943 RepID=I2NB74_STRT9|nr:MULTISPECIES: hypothetical protein [Streptomyces]AZK98009.1 hypothetical protein B7R87_32055 [Streptomyces tsukubensis]EIF94271.1 hypothetical protein [Streptomyces tsukubensis NRRL18488]MYS64405.1 hypothetical protein [Streptomyces sp. SID5473]QKM66068.1 hypothetical protein STSU_001725 [Streptomyces tsukubensis NRRL18488]TAI42349.1 hypothetical protein EWI31_22465 [Streptomyces tsukubensis]
MGNRGTAGCPWDTGTALNIDIIHNTRPSSPSLSAGGRDVVFQSTADDIVPGDTNGTSDVFLRTFR